MYEARVSGCVTFLLTMAFSNGAVWAARRASAGRGGFIVIVDPAEEYDEKREVTGGTLSFCFDDGGSSGHILCFNLKSA
jgi:galactokinase/mevalonate kinase-like predicted kinase